MKWTSLSKNQIAINTADARPSRFTGERIDCAISDLDFDKRRATLSIKLLEELEKKEALEKYGAEDSGKIFLSHHYQPNLVKKIKRNRNSINKIGHS